VKLEFFADLGHGTSKLEIDRLGEWMEGTLPPLVQTKSASKYLEPDDDMSPEAAAVWRRLVAETEAEEQSVEGGEREREEEYTMSIYSNK
jgi:hypothetical protein